MDINDFLTHCSQETCKIVCDSTEVLSTKARDDKTRFFLTGGRAQKTHEQRQKRVKCCILSIGGETQSDGAYKRS